MVEEEEYKNDGDDRDSQGEGEGFSVSRKSDKKKKKRLQQQRLQAEEEPEVPGDSPVVEKSGKKKGKKRHSLQNSMDSEVGFESDVKSSKTGRKRKHRSVEEVVKAEEEEEEETKSEGFEEEEEEEDEERGRDSAMSDGEEEMLDIAVNRENGDDDDDDDEDDDYDEEEDLSLQKELKEHLLKEAAKAKKRGVCYLSRIPPNMDHVKLRHILSKLGEIKRIYLAPEDPSHVNRRNNKGGRARPRDFSEGWVEFANKSVAKRVANMLNGEQIGGRKRSQFYYDLWNIKYLSKFKWDDLTEEIAYKNAVREQKLALEIAAAKRERDFYLKKVDQHLAQTAIKDRLEKKQKVQEAPKFIRQFPQRKPVVNEAEKSKPKLSTDVLAGVFGGS